MTKDDGGPAFPHSPARITHSSGDVVWFEPADGMSLRDYFAAQVTPSLIERWDNKENLQARMRWAATTAYELADAMIAERTK